MCLEEPPLTDSVRYKERKETPYTMPQLLSGTSMVSTRGKNIRIILLMIVVDPPHSLPPGHTANSHTLVSDHQSQNANITMTPTSPVAMPVTSWRPGTAFGLSDELGAALVASGAGRVTVAAGVKVLVPSDAPSVGAATFPFTSQPLAVEVGHTRVETIFGS